MTRAMNLIRQASLISTPAAFRTDARGTSYKTRVTREEISALFCHELGYTARDYRHYH